MKNRLLFLMMCFLISLGSKAQISIGETEYATIPEAVAAAVSGDVIGISGVVSLSTEVSVDKPLTFLGGSTDARVELSNSARFIIQQQGPSTIENLTIVGTTSNHVGGVLVLAAGGSLVLRNDTIRDAITNDHGGVFLIEPGSTVEAYNCVFRDNKAAINGGVFFVLGGGTSMTLEDCLFLNNEASYDRDGEKGGAISWIHGDNPGTNVALRCAFIGNTAFHGGAYASESIPMTFVNCTFSNNRARARGGAMWLFHTGAEFTTTLINTTMANNIANGEPEGGAIFMNHPTAHVNLQNSVVAGNTFEDAGGVTGDSGINLDGASSGTITARNSYYQPLPDNLAEDNNSTGNLQAGELFLEGPRVEEGVLWYEVTSEESVLVDLGLPSLLRPYSNTDQRGVERNMDADFITAGSFEFNPKGTTTGIRDNFIDRHLSIFPNPASDFLNIDTQHSGEVLIYNVNGVLVASYPVNAGENRLDLRNLPKNFYLIKKLSKDGVKAARFIKQ